MINWVFLVKDQNLFHRVDTIGNIFTRATATSENIIDGVHSMAYSPNAYSVKFTLKDIGD